jgi:phage shock protein A
MQTSVDQAQKASDTLKQQVGELKRKIDEAERTATTLVARKNAAQAQRKVAEALAGVGSADNAFAALNRFEETVSKEEATAQAFNQLASTGKDDDLEKQFAALGHGSDDELAALKRERQQLKPPSIPLSLAAPGEKAGQAGGQ